MPLLTLGTFPLVGVVVLVFIWSVFGWSANVTQQARLSALDPARAPVLFSLHSAGIYLGSSAGAAIGGLVLSRSDYSALGPAGAVLVLLSVLTIAAVAGLRRS